MKAGRNQERDVVTVDGTSYICAVDHIASATFKADRDLLKWQVMAARGLDAYIYEGEYEFGVAYAARAGVLFNGDLYTTITGADGDAPPPGSPDSPWLLLATRRPITTSELYDVNFGMQLDAILLETATEVIKAFMPGLPAPGAALHAKVAVRPYILPVGLLGSYARLLEASTDAVRYPIEKDDVEVGSVDVAAGSDVATLTFPAQVQVNPGDL